MAVGDDAVSAGFPLVPGTDQVKNGATEINRTRDFIAQVKLLIGVGKTGARNNAGITSGSADPTGGDDGDIYFKVI